MEPCLTVENLEWAPPGGRTLGKDISLALTPGQVLWIQGPNGSGKSTLIHTLLGDIKPRSGRVLNALGVERIGYLPQVQNRECHLPLTLGEVIELAHNGASARATVNALGLLEPSRLNLAWNRASGGERQRTLLLRELAARPALLFLDEPLNHLDEASRKLIQETIAELLEKPEAPAIVLVSHEGLGLAKRLPRGGYRIALAGDGSAKLEKIESLPRQEIAG